MAWKASINRKDFRLRLRYCQTGDDVRDHRYGLKVVFEIPANPNAAKLQKSGAVLLFRLIEILCNEACGRFIEKPFEVEKSVLLE